MVFLMADWRTETSWHPRSISKKHRLIVLSDAEVAMLCWERWGRLSLNHWIGEFAFILWDSAENQLLAARDHFGARTLHYHANSSRIVIASGPKCIHALGDLPRELDQAKNSGCFEPALSRWRAYFFFKGVKRIPPAGLITVSGGALNVQKYYELRENIRPVHYKSDAQYVEAARGAI